MFRSPVSLLASNSLDNPGSFRSDHTESVNVGHDIVYQIQYQEYQLVF
jgi:hypothetical protein